MRCFHKGLTLAGKTHAECGWHYPTGGMQDQGRDSSLSRALCFCSQTVHCSQLPHSATTAPHLTDCIPQTVRQQKRFLLYFASCPVFAHTHERVTNTPEKCGPTTFRQHFHQSVKGLGRSVWLCPRWRRIGGLGCNEEEKPHAFAVQSVDSGS